MDAGLGHLVLVVVAQVEASRGLQGGAGQEGGAGRRRCGGYQGQAALEQGILGAWHFGS